MTASSTSFSSSSRKDYWQEASRPLSSLLFVIPILLIYEWGVLSHSQLTNEPLRNGMDYWLRAQLAWCGFPYEWAAPIFVLVVLTSIHILKQEQWSIRLSTLGGMLAETVIFAGLLVTLGQLLPWPSAASPAMQIESPQRSESHPQPITTQRPVTLTNEYLQQNETSFLSEIAIRDFSSKLATPSADAWPTPTPRLHWLTCLGAGIYEELVFRLLLLPVIYGGIRLIGAPPQLSLIVSVVSCAIVFATAHYLQVDMEQQGISVRATIEYLLANRDLWAGFSFRVIAGCLFGALLMIRGYGVAVGCHACYDLFVGYWMV